MSLKTILTKLVNNFRKSKGRDPNYAIVNGKKIYKTEYKKIINKPTVIVKTYNSDKDPILKQFSTAIKGKFNNATEFYNLVKKNENYDYEVGDTKDLVGEIKALNTDEGLNCVNYAQVLAKVLDLLNKQGKQYVYDYVRTYCVKDKVGHHYLRVKGEELGNNWVNMDLAAATGSNYNIGNAWCMDYPEKEYNWDTLKKDDGR